MVLSYLKYLLDFFTSLSDDDDDLLCLISHNIIHFLPMWSDLMLIDCLTFFLTRQIAAIDR